MRVLITGSKGRLGSRLGDVLTHHTVIGIDADQLDVTDFTAVRAFVCDQRPDVVVHTAAWTDVDGCARDPQRAIVVNGFGAQHVAVAAAEIGAAVLQVSTNEVFDGASNRPYYEYDAPNPINPYAYSKFVGEQVVQRLNPRHYIVRTAWLFAHGGKNFIQAILSAAQANKPLRVVTDEIANPTYTDDLAAAIAVLIESGRYGVYHLVNAGFCSRYDFARYVLDRAGFADTPIERITRDQWSRPSTPPSFTPLENLAGAQVGLTLRDWQVAVDVFLSREGLLKP
jgi:dTDP-4-dehydrorhamnose reductase